MSWTPPNFNAGQYPPASDIEYTTDQVADLTAPGWLSYGMVLTGFTTNPTLGSSTLEAIYRQVPGTDIVDLTFKLTIGAGFVVGSGIYQFSLPVPMIAPQIFTGVSAVLDNGTAMRSGIVIAINANQVVTYYDGAGAALGSGGPGTAWATGDFVSASISYGV